MTLSHPFEKRKYWIISIEVKMEVTIEVKKGVKVGM